MAEKKSPSKTTPKDFFLNLGVIVSLYFSIISLISLMFAVINNFFPDSVSYDYTKGVDTIRITVSSLIILFPLYLYLTRVVNRDIALNPEKKNIWIKKWSTYLTLFLTVATIATDLIVTLNIFLGGEITTRFVCKVVAVLIVIGIVFAYYIYDLRRDPKETDTKSRKLSRTMLVISSLLVLLSIVGGFFTIGSPFQERLRKFDDRRVQDLTSIQYQIVNYWQQKQQLPTTLPDLNDPLSSFMVPTDPETFTSYEYQQLGSTSFALCATFDLPSRTQSTQSSPMAPVPYGALDQSFPHGKGRTCFDRTIDPSRYPPTSTSTKIPVTTTPGTTPRGKTPSAVPPPAATIYNQ
jgi:hypothetical protein